MSVVPSTDSYSPFELVVYMYEPGAVVLYSSRTQEFFILMPSTHAASGSIIQTFEFGVVSLSPSVYRTASID